MYPLAAVTVRVAVPLSAAEAPVIVAVPGPPPYAKPLESTVATVMSDDDQLFMFAVLPSA